MRKLFRNKKVRFLYFFFLYLFAAYGAFLTLTYLAMRFNWTNDSGMVDANNRYFQEMHDKYNQNFKVDSVSMQKHRYEVINRIIVLNEYYPKNAQMILQAYQKTDDERLALQMLDAADLRLLKNSKYKRTFVFTIFQKTQIRCIKHLKRKSFIVGLLICLKNHLCILGIIFVQYDDPVNHLIAVFLHGDTIYFEILIVFVMHFLKIAIVGIHHSAVIRPVEAHSQIGQRQECSISSEQIQKEKVKEPDLFISEQLSHLLIHPLTGIIPCGEKCTKRMRKCFP